MQKEPTSAAPAIQKVSKEAIRLLVLQHGQREAARIAGLNEDTVCSWAYRYNWSTPTSASKTQANGHSSLVQRVSDELADNERETRLQLARAHVAHARQATKKGPGYAKTVAEGARITHRWGSDMEKATFSLNVLNLGNLGVTIADEGEA